MKNRWSVPPGHGSTLPSWTPTKKNTSPLQPIEKKLCAWSLGVGLTLMAVFIGVFERI